MTKPCPEPPNEAYHAAGVRWVLLTTTAIGTTAMGAPSKLAYAQEENAAPSNPSFTHTEPLAVTPPAPPRADVRDANADRVVVMPTAYTHPAGTVTASTYDILLLQAGYSFTDTTQLALTSSIPVEGLVLADLSVKSVIARDGPVRLAAIGSVTGVWGLDSGNGLLGRAGAVAQFCFDDECRSSVSVAGTMFLGGSATIAMTGVGLIWRVAPWLALLGEADTLVPTTLAAGRYHGIGVAPGIRFPHRAWSLDLALVAPLDTNPSLTIPFAAFTVRFLPSGPL
jgi:hypothetical protein